MTSLDRAREIFGSEQALLLPDAFEPQLLDVALRHRVTAVEGDHAR
jgi:hypothetical protein